MDSPPPPPSQPASTSASLPYPAVADRRRGEPDKEIVHKTKVIQFLGRSTPVILQKDNGPCPLLAICNVLSLRNCLNLSPDISEILQEKLLSLVAERLIDSNSTVNDKDTGYAKNQQLNIADAIDLLPRLTTGIDVNIKFRSIDDFEFTPERAIFDLLGIPLYHGWIVDPQDYEIAYAIGSKSYDTLLWELVSLESQTVEDEHKKNTEDGADDVDFFAATTAPLGVPSPSLSRGQSFDESPHKPRKGDIEEVAELFRALKLSEAEGSNSLSDGVSDDINFHKNACVKNPELMTHLGYVEEDTSDGTAVTRTLISSDVNPLSNHLSQEVSYPFLKMGQENNSTQPSDEESRNVGHAVGSDTGTKNEKVQSLSVEHELPCSQGKIKGDEHAQNELITTSEPDEQRNPQNDCKENDRTGLLSTPAGLDSASDHVHNTDDPKAILSNFDNSEPIYEGEECLLDSGTIVYESPETVYEGEVVLAEQVDKMDDDGLNGKGRISSKQGEIIRIFLRTSASQLTVYGLFCLQDKVKENEPCILFRNNHFNTMFKYEGELYILVTDLGYINQPDLVWEKLNEVNGDTLYMTGDFKEFKMDDYSNIMWNEQNTMDYLAGTDNTEENSTSNSDLVMAMSLREDFKEQQQEWQNQRNMQRPAMTDGSKLDNSPQGSHSSGKYADSSSKRESQKSKKCILM